MADTTTETPLETNSKLIREIQTLADNLPEAGGTSFRLVYQKDFVLESEVAVYQEDINENVHDFSEMLVLMTRGATPTETMQNWIAIDGVVFSSFDGTNNKNATVYDIFYLKRLTSSELIRLFRETANSFSWTGKTSETMGFSYFSNWIGDSTQKFVFNRNKTVDSQNISIKVYVR